MKFKEAKMETHGCNDQWMLLYKKSAKFTGKNECPHNHIRCCVFCTENCPERCDLSRALWYQPVRLTTEFNCPRLVENKELVWKFLLGPNVPRL